MPEYGYTMNPDSESTFTKVIPWIVGIGFLGAFFFPLIGALLGLNIGMDSKGSNHTYEFWTPSHLTCKDITQSEMSGQWCDEDERGNRRLMQWLVRRGVDGWARWEVEARSNNDVSKFRPGYHYKVTDSSGLLSQIEIAAVLMHIFGDKLSPVIYMEEIQHPNKAVVKKDTVKPTTNMGKN